MVIFAQVLKKAILFGSYVRNKQRKWSDIDLALVANEFTGVASIDIRPFVFIIVSDKKFIGIEPHTFQTDYFEQGDPFIDEIKRTGIELPLKKLPAPRPKRATSASKSSAPQTSGEPSATPAA